MEKEIKKLIGKTLVREVTDTYGNTIRTRLRVCEYEKITDEHWWLYPAERTGIVVAVSNYEIKKLAKKGVCVEACEKINKIMRLE